MLLSPEKSSRSNSQFGSPPIKDIGQPLRSPLKIRDLNSKPPGLKPDYSPGLKSETTLHFQPTTIQSHFFEQNQSNVTSSNVNDSSTLIGDDYNNWREEKIRELREM